TPRRNRLPREYMWFLSISRNLPWRRPDRGPGLSRKRGCFLPTAPPGAYTFPARPEHPPPGGASPPELAGTGQLPPRSWFPWLRPPEDQSGTEWLSEPGRLS